MHRKCKSLKSDIRRDSIFRYGKTIEDFLESVVGTDTLDFLACFDLRELVLRKVLLTSKSNRKIIFNNFEEDIKDLLHKESYLVYDLDCLGNRVDIVTFGA